MNEQQQPTQILRLRLEQASYKKVLEHGFAWVMTLTVQTTLPQAKNHSFLTMRLTFVEGTVTTKVESANRENKEGIA